MQMQQVHACALQNSQMTAMMTTRQYVTLAFLQLTLSHSLPKSHHRCEQQLTKIRKCCQDHRLGMRTAVERSFTACLADLLPDAASLALLTALQPCVYAHQGSVSVR